MDTLKDLIAIYCGENAIFNHIALFSFIGITVIAILNYGYSIFGNILSTSLFDFVALSPLQTYLFLLLGIMFLLFLTGFLFNWMHNVFQGNLGLPELSLCSYTAFLKMFPVIFIWKMYSLIALIVGFLLPFASPIFYIYYSVLICLSPFVYAIYVFFAEAFKYRKFFFNPFSLLKILNVTLGGVIKLVFTLLLLSILPVLILYIMFHFSQLIIQPFVKLGCKLLVFCLGGYFLFVFQALFSIGIVKIIQKHSMNKLL